MHPSELRARRRRLGLSQSELAKRLSVPANTVSRWETGKLAIRHPEMLRLAMESIEHDLLHASEEEKRERNRQVQQALLDEHEIAY